MKKKRLSYQLNSNHLTYIVISLAVLFWGNILLLEFTVDKKVKTQVVEKGEMVFNHLMSTKTNQEESIHPGQLSNQLQNYYFQDGEGCLIYDKDSHNIIELTGDVYSKDQIVSDELMKHIEGYNESVANVYELDLTDKGKPSFIYISTIEDKPNTIFIFYASSRFIDNFGRYPAWFGAMFGLIFVILFWAILFINHRLAAPYSEIAQSILNRPETNVNISGNQHESMLIKRAVNLMQNQLLFYEKNIEKTSLDQQKFEKDIKIARSLQKRILPKDIGKQIQDTSVEIEAKSEALFEVGGDFYDYYMLDEEHMLFTIGDVAGKGIPASLFMIFSQTTMRSIANPGMNAGEIVTKLNERIIEENVSDLFFTLFLGIINIQTGVLQYCNAAHNHPVLIKSSGSLEELHKTHGIPVGIYTNKTYVYSELKLNIGDQLVVYTDGLVDTIDENEMDYSVDVLKYNLLGAWFLTPNDIIKKIFESVENFKGNVKAVDDMTIVALKYSPRAK